MRRVIVVGPCGAGKSTLARRLATILHMPVYHMDQFIWSAGWIQTPLEQWRAAVERAVRGDAWVLDGNPTSAYAYCAADTVVFLDLPRSTCIGRVVRRIATTFGRVRPDMAPGCPEKLDWEFLRYVWDYPVDRRPVVLESIRRYASGNGKRVVTLRRPVEVERFVREVERTCLS
jgi:adenylate kinase family enzyme